MFSEKKRSTGIPYWSSTTKINTSDAFGVNFDYGVGNNTTKNPVVPYNVRCVRGGVYGGSFGKLSVSPSDHGFGTYELGTESNSQTFTVTNNGTVNRTITAVDKTGTAPAPNNYILQNDECTSATLTTSGAGSTCTFEAVFAPVGLGLAEATLIVRAGTAAAAVATLTGTGVDTTPPTGSILINNGAATTTTTAVTLTLSATDPGGSGVNVMRLHNNGDSWGSWESFATTKAWTLKAGAGTKTVYVQFKDFAGNVS